MRVTFCFWASVLLSSEPDRVYIISARLCYGTHLQPISLSLPSFGYQCEAQNSYFYSPLSNLFIFQFSKSFKYIGYFFQLMSSNQDSLTVIKY